MLLIAAASLFAVRGVDRASRDSRDFAVAYIASSAWLDGSNPYDHDELDRLWLRRAGMTTGGPDRYGSLSVYPPAALVTFAPLGWLDWRPARMAMLVVNVGLWILVLMLLGQLAGLDGWHLALFGAVALAFAPLHTGLAKSNIVVPAAALGCLSFYAAMTGRSRWAGILAGVAAGVKLPIGIAVIAYYVFCKRMKIAVIAAVTLAALSGLAAISLAANDISWLSALVANNRIAVGPGGINDPSPANPFRYQLINLQYPLYSVFSSTWVVNAIALSIAAVLLVVWVQAVRRARQSGPDLLSFGAWLAIALLPIYHRSYDAIVLFVPLAWSLSRLQDSGDRLARTNLALTMMFLVPGSALLAVLTARGYVPEALAGSWLWTAVILPHQAWVVAAIAVTLVTAMAYRSRPQPR